MNIEWMNFCLYYVNPTELDYAIFMQVFALIILKDVMHLNRQNRCGLSFHEGLAASFDIVHFTSILHKLKRSKIKFKLLCLWFPKNNNYNNNKKKKNSKELKFETKRNAKMKTNFIWYLAGLLDSLININFLLNRD